MRDLKWVQEEPKSINYESWRVGKLLAQQKKFNNDLIENMISSLSTIDIKCKTSDSNLKDELDFMFVKHLELNTLK
jgi:hypothetical protein